MKWSKGPGDAWTAMLDPFTAKVLPKGDGRFTWQVSRGASANPTATGVASSLGAAKTAAEQFMKRS